MSATKKKTKDAEVDAAPVENLEQLILNKKSGKYGVVSVISFWAKELKKLEENRHLDQTEILDLAMTDVLSGKASEKELLKKMVAAPETNGQTAEPSEKPKKKS